jgi:hypothetical protein
MMRLPHKIGIFLTDIAWLNYIYIDLRGERTPRLQIG